jgi:hypothetical protein
VLAHSKQTCSEYLDLAQTHGRKWQRMLQHERDQRLRLEDMVEQLARQLGGLEQAAKEHSIPVRNRSSECFKYYDVVSNKMHGGDVISRSRVNACE